MQYKIAFCDKEGKEYGVLDKVDENTTLSNIRLQGAKNLKFFPTRYSFIWKDTPISLRQETILKVNKYAEGKYGKDQTLKILIAVNSLNSEGKHGQSSGVSTNHEQTHSTTSNEKVNTVNMHVKLCKLKTFCDNELADPSISTLEKERRYFWNNLSAKVDSHQVYKDWSLQARTGIVDTEWTLKKTELLKLDADEVLKRLDNNKKSKSGSGKKVRENLDRLLQTELRRKSTYKKIENLHKNLKSSSTDHQKIKAQIAIEEDVLDKIFTELKSSQSSLEMAVTRSSVCQNATDTVTDSDKSVNLNTVAVSPGLTEDEIMHVVTSTMDDFSVEYGE